MYIVCITPETIHTIFTIFNKVRSTLEIVNYSLGLLYTNYSITTFICIMARMTKAPRMLMV